MICTVKRTTAFKLVAIASNKILSNVSHVKHLPPSWRTLYELAVVANKGFDLEAGIESGAIHPKMERKDVRALLPHRHSETTTSKSRTTPSRRDPLAIAWEAASREERASFLQGLGRKVLLEALEALQRAADRAEARSEPKWRPPGSIDETATDDLSDTLVARMWRGESVGAPEEPYTALANGNGADRWSEK